jgi:hypothetical protein
MICNEALQYMYSLEEAKYWFGSLNAKCKNAKKK